MSAKAISLCVCVHLLTGEASSGSAAARWQREEMAALSSWTRELLNAPRTMTYPCALNSAICSGESAAIAAAQCFAAPFSLLLVRAGGRSVHFRSGLRGLSRTDLPGECTSVFPDCSRSQLRACTQFNMNVHHDTRILVVAGGIEWATPNAGGGGRSRGGGLDWTPAAGWWRCFLSPLLLSTAMSGLFGD